MKINELSIKSINHQQQTGREEVMNMALEPIKIGDREVTPILIDNEPAIQATDAARYLGLTSAAFTRKRAQWNLKGHVNRADTRRVWFKIKDLEPYTGFTPEE